MQYVTVDGERRSLSEKLLILSDAAKYDVACTSSGVERRGNGRDMGNCVAAGICHSFPRTGGASRFSRSSIQISVFTTANTV